MQFDEMQARVREYLEDDGTTKTWSVTVVDRYINDGLKDFAIRTKCYKRRSGALAEAATTPDNAFYTLPADFYELERVESGGYQLAPIALDELPDTWDTLTAGSPTHFLLSDLGVAELRVYPTPTAALTALKIHYAALPADVTGTTVPTGVPSAFHIAAVYYAVAECYKRNSEDEDLQKAAEFWGRYMREVETCENQIARRLQSRGVVLPYRRV